MATTLTEHGHVPLEAAHNDDPFHDPILWNANSYPPPIVHRW